MERYSMDFAIVPRKMTDHFPICTTFEYAMQRYSVLNRDWLILQKGTSMHKSIVGGKVIFNQKIKEYPFLEYIGFAVVKLSTLYRASEESYDVQEYKTLEDAINADPHITEDPDSVFRIVDAKSAFSGLNARIKETK